MRHFEAAYLDAFREYIDEPCEITLRNAYELGRDAVERGLSVLDVAVAHHDALARVLGSESAGNDDERIVRAAGDFFLESVSSFEMVHRGFQEARDAASLELRHAEMLRQLSHFLADASLAIDGSNSLDEILRLVAEQARELVPADCSLVATGSAQAAQLRAASYPETDLRWAAFVRWADLADVSGLLRSTGRSMRLRTEDIARHVRIPGGASAADLELRDWLATPLTALDGGVIGALHLISESDDKFTSLDEAVVVHVAQMSAAAIERARLYGRAAR